MLRGRWILAAVAGLGLACLIAWLTLRLPVRPVYRGKSLDYWLQGYERVYSGTRPITNYYSPDIPSWPETDEALKAMGTNAVPALVLMLRHKDSRAKLWLWAFLQKYHLLHVRPLLTYARWDACQALSTLGPTASNAVPALIEMLKTDKSAFGQTCSTTLLGYIGPPALDAVPALLQFGVTHTNAIVRCNAIFALRSINPPPPLVVPQFRNALRDPDPNVRVVAEDALIASGVSPKKPGLTNPLNKAGNVIADWR